MTIAIIPATRRWRPWLEHEAIRIFGGLAGSSRRKVRQKLMADAISKGVPRPVAEADVADAMDFIEARIELYAQAQAVEPQPALRGRAG